MTSLRYRLRAPRWFRRSFIAGLASVLESAADDSETLCACAEGHRCVA